MRESMTVQLKGITWNHSRGYLPTVATAQRFCETHPGVEITWEKRSLQEFADFPIQHLVEKYDLLVIDHPWAGYAAKHQVLVPLDPYLSVEYLEDQARNSVGKSHESYIFNGQQFALAIDAATPVASYRKDLFEKEERVFPETWDDILALAKDGKVILPGIPIDTLMNFYMICSTLGEDPFLNEETVISEQMGILALNLLRELVQLCPEEVFKWNPIAVYEQLTSRNNYLYCPFAYGYTNYSRTGYTEFPIHFTDMVTLQGQKCKSTLGGTGIAISTACVHRELAVEYARYVASPECQKTIFLENGGQPGHRGVWIDDHANAFTRDFFRSTLPGLDRAYLRPRYCGYLDFQDHGGNYVQEYIRHDGDPRKVLDQLNQLYQKSKEASHL
jgi:multiple sugar transport system substrate-binding protein